MEVPLSAASEETVKELSRLYSEPDWLTQHRLASFELFTKLPPERSPLYAKYADMLAGLDLSSISLRLSAESSTAPPEGLLTQIGGREEGVLLLQEDSEEARAIVREELKKEGLMAMDVRRAFRERPDFVKGYFARKAVRPEEDKFAALNNALFNSGTLLYVPEGLEIKVPVRSVALIRSRGAGVLAYNIIIAEAGSRLTYLEETHSMLDGPQGGPSLYSEVTEMYLGQGAEVNFASVQNFEDGVHAFSNRRAVCEGESKANWTFGHLGGSIIRSRVDSVLGGPGATAEDVEVVFGAGAQRFDIVTDLTHRAPYTTGSVMARGVLRDKARSIFKGMIRIEKGAKNSNSYLAEHAMLLSREARADAVPGLEIATNEVKATHSASVAQMDEEQVFYLMTRGLKEGEAKKKIVLGFLEPTVQRMPVKEVKLGIRYLIEEKWSGRKGGWPIRDEMLSELAEEVGEVARPVTRDLFERHYKYR